MGWRAFSTTAKVLSRYVDVIMIRANSTRRWTGACRARACPSQRLTTAPSCQIVADIHDFEEEGVIKGRRLPPGRNNVEPPGSGGRPLGFSCARRPPTQPTQGDLDGKREAQNRATDEPESRAGATRPSRHRVSWPAAEAPRPKSCWGPYAVDDPC